MNEIKRNLTSDIAEVKDEFGELRARMGQIGGPLYN